MSKIGFRAQPGMLVPIILDNMVFVVVIRRARSRDQRDGRDELLTTSLRSESPAARKGAASRRRPQSRARGDTTPARDRSLRRRTHGLGDAGCSLGDACDVFSSFV